ncbi:MAG TPA: acetylxylan esterase [Pseudonocardiaceae bacterium]|nr:acetylxylan esterase [Pseudonocardiaceae bacterium]
MALYDLPEAELRDYRPIPPAPADLADFWRRTLTETQAVPVDARFTPVDAAMSNVAVHDVRFAGWGGADIAAWLLVPRDGQESAPCVVQYLGYGMGRGLPHDHTMWPAAGWATLGVDTRGVSGRFGVPGDTPDPHGGGWPHVPGFLTDGIDDPAHYYYRRVFADSVRALAAAAAAPGVDPARLVVAGASQGGAIAQAVGALHGLTAGPAPLAALIDVPFLTHVRRAVDITDEFPYYELVQYLSTRRTDQRRVFDTLAYFDGFHLAPLGTIPALYSVALRDPICPPSTVFAAYHAWSGPKRIEVWPFNEHEGGGPHHRGIQLRYVREVLSGEVPA